MSDVNSHRPNRRQKLSKSKHGTLHELNITPLLDLVMVLLIIFMITTPQLSNDLDLNLPSGKAKPSTPKEKPKINYVDIDSSGGLELNKQPVVLKELPALFDSLKKVNPEPSVVIRGADDVNYQYVISVIDILQQSDITKVGLATALKKN
jgi:biopolymer transport protein ExbD